MLQIINQIFRSLKPNLPILERDHYELVNAEVRQKEYPNTFVIPSQELRENMAIGKIVKLIFKMESITDSKELEVERMWVKILYIKNDYYIGILDNDPYSDVFLEADDKICFKANHIIDILDD